MKRRIFTLILAICMVFSLLPMNALAKGDVGERKKTGLRAPTEREEKLFKEKAKTVKKVLPNADGLKRINDARIKKGLQPLSNIFVAADGEDIIPTQKSAKSEKKYVSILNSYSEINEVLPATVDLSLDSHFPAIGDQGYMGSCASFATAYYAATHETAVQRNINLADHPNRILSPKFNYNLNNDGENKGSSIYGNLATLYTRGAPFTDETSMSNYQYNGYDFSSPGVVNPLQYREYPQEASIYNDALKNRIADFGTITGVNTADGFTQIKQMLNNSHVLVLVTYYMYDWLDDKLVKDDPAITEDDPYAGQFACYGMVVPDTNDYSGHAMTVVGYNDDLWVDIDGDNTVDSFEKGALKIANSWGTGWGNAGFIWLSYNALQDANGHEGVIADDELYYITAQDEYTPKATAEITINTARRNQLWLLSGVNYENTLEPLNAYYDYVFSGDWGGEYSLAGTDTATLATVVIDMTDALYEEGFGGAAENYNLFAGVMDSLDDAYAQQIESVVYKTGTSIPAADSMPQNINNDLYWFSSKSKGNVYLRIVANSLQGSATGEGSYPFGSTVTLQAIPKQDFSFVRWAEDGETLSINPELTLTLWSNRDISAEFEYNYCMISTLYKNNIYGGNVTGTGMARKGFLVTLRAAPFPGYRFKRWLDEDTTLSTNAEYSFVVTGERSIYVEFEEIPPPTLTVNAIDIKSIRLNWTAVDGATSYIMFRSTSVDGVYAYNGSMLGGTSFTDINLIHNMTYYYKVQACFNGYSINSYSNIASARTAPAAPTNLKAVQTGATSIKLTFNKVVGASRYEIWSSTSETGEYKKIATTSARSYTQKRLKEGNTYYYKVRAYTTYRGKKIYSDFSAPVSLSIPIPIPPETPQSLAAVQAGAKSIRLSFAPASGAAKYEVYYSTKPNGNFRRLTATAATSYTQKKLKAGRTYYYKVRAYRVVWGRKIYSAYSDTVSCTCGL